MPCALIAAVLITPAALAQVNVIRVANVGPPLKDVWGYADGLREYALCCAGTSLVIYEVTWPDSPEMRANIQALSTDLKDVKTLGSYAYAVNQVGALEIIDLLSINFLFKSGPPPEPLHRMDVDGNCTANAADLITMVNRVFKSGPPFAVPCGCP